MDKNNPIRYSDLVQDDGAIKKLIDQLEELNETYGKTLAELVTKAENLAKSLKKVSGATEEGQQQTRKAATEAERLAREQEKLKQASGETAEEIAKLKQAQREAAQITKLKIKLNQAEEGSYNRLSAQYALNKIKLNQMSDAMRNNTKEGKELETETRKIYERMKELQEATGKFQLNVGNYPQLTAAASGYANKLTDILGLNSQFGESLLNLGSGGKGIIGIFKAMGAGVTAFGRTLFGLLANPVFVAIAGIAGAGVAIKWWFDYNKGLIEATRLTQQFTQLSGGELKSYRNEVQAIADIYGKDFKEVLIAANALAKQFGISSAESLELIRQGFVNGADVNDEFIDSLKEYPAYFQEAGISAEGFVAIITQGAKQGVFSDKAVDAIKEGNLRIREMTKSTADAFEMIGISSTQVQRDLQSGAKTTFQIMQEVSAKLAELPDSSAKVGTAIADIFGGPGEDAGLQYLRTLKDISLNMDEVSAKTGEYAIQQDKLLESELELNNTISGLFDLTEDGFESMITGAKIFANESITKIIRGLVDVINWFIRLYNESIAIRAIFETVKVAISSLWDFMVAFVENAIYKIKALGSVIYGAFTLDIDKIKEGWNNYLNSNIKLIKKTFGKIKENISESVDNIMNGKVKEIVIPVKTENVSDKKPFSLSRVTTKNPVVGDGSSVLETKKEEDKEFLRLEQQKLESVWALNKDANKKLSDLSAKSIDDKIKAVNEEIQSAQGKESEGGQKDIYDLFGLNLDDEKKEAINMSLDYAKQALFDFMDAKVQAAQAAVAAADKEVDSAQKALDAERTAAANGYASNVAYAQKELDLAKKNQERAMKEQQKAQKQQAAIQSIQQVGNLVTASSMIWSQLGFPWAIPAIGIMWASFAASKIKAAQITKNEKYGEGTVELLEGGSHQSGNDIDLGTKEDGTKRRAEGGEFFAVINKRNSRKYRKLIPDVIKSLNNGSFEKKYSAAFAGEGMAVNVSAGPDISGMKDDVHAIRKQNERRMYVDGEGNTIETYKNLTRKIRR